VNTRELNGFDTAEDLPDTPAQESVLWMAPDYLVVVRFRFHLTEAVAADTIVPVVALNHIDRDGSTELEASAALITFADEDAIGDFRTVDLETNATYNVVLMEPGEYCGFEHMTAGTDTGTAAGQGWYSIAYRVVSVPKNGTCAEDTNAPT